MLSFLPLLLAQGTNTNEIQFNIGEQAVEQNIPGATALWSTAPEAGFGLLISQVLMIALTVGAIAVLLYLLWGALDWLTSAGDKGKTEKARDKITQAIVGLILIISTAAIMLFVQQLLGICVIDIGGTGCKTAGGNAGATTCASKGGVCVSAPVECTDSGGSLIAGSCSNSNTYCCKY